MGLAEQFYAAETQAEKEAIITEARKERVLGDPSAYVALPIPVMAPRQSAGIATLTPQAPDIKIFWVVGLPGIHGTPDNPIREALQMPFPSEEVAEDFAFILTVARQNRTEGSLPNDGEAGNNVGEESDSTLEASERH